MGLVLLVFLHVQFLELQLEVNNPLPVVVRLHALCMICDFFVAVGFKPLRERSHCRLKLFIWEVLSKRSFFGQSSSSTVRNWRITRLGVTFSRSYLTTSNKHIVRLCRCCRSRPRPSISRSPSTLRNILIRLCRIRCHLSLIYRSRSLLRRFPSCSFLNSCLNTFLLLFFLAFFLRLFHLRLHNVSAQIFQIHLINLFALALVLRFKWLTLVFPLLEIFRVLTCPLSGFKPLVIDILRYSQMVKQTFLGYAFATTIALYFPYMVLILLTISKVLSTLNMFIVVFTKLLLLLMVVVLLDSLVLLHSACLQCLLLLKDPRLRKRI